QLRHRSTRTRPPKPLHWQKHWSDTFLLRYDWPSYHSGLSVGDKCGNADLGLTLRAADVAEIPRFHHSSRPHSRSRHRSDHGDFHADTAADAAAARGRAPRPALAHRRF